MHFPLSKRLLLLTSSLLSCQALSAQSIPFGEVVFTGYNSTADSDNTNTKGEFSFVLLSSVQSGQILSFTDRGWLSTGGFREGEGILTLTFDSFYACSTEFRVFQAENSWTVEVLSGTGSPSISESGDFSLSSAGDQIFGYNGNTEPTVAAQGAFVTALQFAGAWQSEASGIVESTQPTIFANNPGSDFVIDPHFDHGKYNCLINAGATADLRANIYNLSNWEFDNSSSNQFDLSTACTFFCQGVCTAPNIERISTDMMGNIFCPGDKITFNIDGNLNDASLWSLYSGSCNGEQLTTSNSNTIEWTATKSGTFYIGGLGGCVTSPSCVAINITVEGGPTAICQDVTINFGESLTATDLDGGSLNNCADFTLSVDEDSFDCESLGEKTVLLYLEDTLGQRDSCQAIVTVLGEDEDCDGVADECDACPGGNDKIDNNENNVSDCTEALPVEDIIEAWRCGPLLDSILVCKITNGDFNTAQTECRLSDEVKEVLNAGGYLGPCGNTPSGMISHTTSIGYVISLGVYPNPARNQVFIEIPDLPFDNPQLRLYNAYGQIIYQRALQPHIPQTISWELGALTVGIYLISLENQHGFITQEKLLVLP